MRHIHFTEADNEPHGRAKQGYDQNKQRDPGSKAIYALLCGHLPRNAGLNRAITSVLKSKYREMAQQWREMAEQTKLLAITNGHQSHQSEPQYSGHHCSPLVISLAMLQEFKRLQPRSATTNQGNPQPH